MFAKTFALAILATSALAAPSSRGFGCGAPEPTSDQLEDARSFYQQWLTSLDLGIESRDEKAFNVKTYVHVVSASRSSYITEKQIADQMKVLNDSYAPHGVSFTLAGTDFTANPTWARDGDEMGMKAKLRKGTYSDLNLYFLDAPQEGALGYCYFPVANPSTQAVTQDGCVIMAESVPGGTAEPYNLGGTSVHEVGHWMNLYHTFQGGCSGGDQIDDTPAQASASSGCPVGRDSCPSKAGVDPIHNYMDYSSDECYESFTAGQRARMHDAWTRFRQ